MQLRKTLLSPQLDIQVGAIFVLSSGAGKPCLLQDTGVTLTMGEDNPNRNGAAGIDGQSVAAFAAQLPEEIARIARKLKEKGYRPKPVRRVEISNPDGCVRKLGIPAVRDCVVQQALLDILQPIFDPGFHPWLRQLGYKGEFKAIKMNSWRNAASPLANYAIPNSWLWELGFFEVRRVETGYLLQNY